MNNFWQKLKKPIMVLAPMADVTDAAFRRIVARYSKYGGRDIGDGSKESLSAEASREGGPDVMFTEFVSADGLCHPEGRKKLLVDLAYSEAERPIVAQLFSSNPDKMREASALVEKLGFDGVDINMGCPDRGVEKQGAGAALIKDSRRARELIRAAKDGAPSLPVSLKTRIGYHKNELETWLPELLAENPSVITVHARTRKEMSNVPAQWEHVREAVEIRNNLRSGTLIFGNGDVSNVADAREKVRKYGADGVMLGRAIFGNPFLFSNSQEFENKNDSKVLKTVLGVMIEHTKLFEELLGKHKNFAVMKKHYKAYVNGSDGAKDLRVKLMETRNAQEVKEVVSDYLKTTN